MKPVFLPLISKYYEAFKDGSKRSEYRLYGDRWNERTCRVGRPVTISKGYGKRNRIYAFVESFKRVQRCDLPPDISALVEYIYAGTKGDVAIITMTEPADKPAEPYRPSSGTEGHAFEASHCAKCIHRDLTTGDPLVDKACMIELNALAHEIGDKSYPSEWIYGMSGSPTCIAFRDKALGPIKKPTKCNKTPDMFT